MVATRERPIVAIDGPAGVGKSTTARAVAKALGFVLVDTGALYRGVALAASERGVSWEDGPALGDMVEMLELAFTSAEDGSPLLHIDGKDRSGDIRTQEVAAGASMVASRPEVRAALLGLQRRLGGEGGVVLEGRDIGTVVFPDAEVKIFLSADPEARAQRRALDLAAKGQDVDKAVLLEQMRARDAKDSERDVAPLKPAEDAVHVDSTAMTIDEVVAKIVALAKA